MGGAPLWRRVIEMVRTPVASPVLRAAAVFSLAAVCWLGITLFHVDVFRALAALTDVPAEAASEDPLFASLSDASQRSFTEAYSYLGVALGFAIWHVKCLEQGDTAVGLVRLMRWSLVVLLALTLAIVVLPYRIVWVDYERVVYDGIPAHIVATTDEQFHLFFDPATNAPSRSIDQGDAELMSFGIFEKLFAEQNSER